MNLQRFVKKLRKNFQARQIIRYCAITVIVRQKTFPVIIVNNAKQNSNEQKVIAAIYLRNRSRQRFQQQFQALSCTGSGPYFQF